jgi:glycosyltransferase involved in cell wall biosynthesis
MIPKISIIIPTFNRETYLAQTLESALSQDYSNYEVIVSDNASIDSTEEVVAKYLSDKRLKYYKNNTNIGMVKNWHKALYEYSTGEWFLILSDDDYFIDNNYLSKCVELIDKDEEVHLVYANGYIKYESTGEMIPLNLPFNKINDGKKIFLSRNQVKPQDFTLCNVLFNKQEALKFKPFENEFNVSCDSELFLKMCIYSKVAIVQEYVSVYRIHSSNLINQVNTSWDLFFHNNEYLLNPYLLAKKSELFSSNEILEFKNLLIIPFIKENILMTKLYFPKSYSHYMHYIQNKDVNIINQIFYDKQFKLKLFLSNIPFIYKLLNKIKLRFNKG